MKHLLQRRDVRLCALLAAAWLLAVSPANAQRRVSRGGQSQQQDITLPLTRDGVSLRATYYPSTGGENAGAVILLHDFEGSRADMAPLAAFLNRELDVAVLAPDLRGHGDSNSLVLPNGTTITAEPSNLRPADFAAMVQGDLEAAKRHLVNENNARRLNIDKLALVGVGMGSMLAANWTASDWSWPAVGGVRQGQFAKAVVLVSPSYSFGGLSIRDALQQQSLRESVGMAIFFGEQSDVARDADRIVRQIEQARKPRRSRRPRRRTADQETTETAETPQIASMSVLKLPNDLSGRDLLSDDASVRQIQPAIQQFLQVNVVNLNVPWEQRTNPLR